MKRLRIIFMGTSIFAVPSLEALVESSHQVIAVVSQPDRPRGRGNRMLPTPVKERALRYDLPVYQFARIKETEAIHTIEELKPDLIVVVSYGQIIPAQILAIPHLGSINVHASLLPLLRGAAPIQRAIMQGENKTGVTTMLMDKGLDTGDILLQEEITIRLDADHGQLEESLAGLGARLLIQTIDRLMEGNVKAQKQNSEQATYASMISREEELIDWSRPALDIHNHVRALSPIPGAYTLFNGERLKLFRSRIYADQGKGEAGTILTQTERGFVVQAGEGALEVLEVQKQGKKRMAAQEFIKGFPLDANSVFKSQEG